MQQNPKRHAQLRVLQNLIFVLCRRMMMSMNQGIPVHQFSGAANPQMHNLVKTSVPGAYAIQGLPPYAAGMPMPTISSQVHKPIDFDEPT